jgi:hypothetical protein
VTWEWTVIELNLVTVAAVVVIVGPLAFGFPVMRGSKAKGCVAHDRGG